MNECLSAGDRVYSELHGWVRFVRWEGDCAVVMGSESLRELPDLVHVVQLKW